MWSKHVSGYIQPTKSLRLSLADISAYSVKHCQMNCHKQVDFDKKLKRVKIEDIIFMESIC